MPISYSSLGGSSGSNDFILDKNNTDNDTFALSQEFAAGGYSLSTNSGDTSYDIYLINASGSAVGYTNGASIVASEAFDTVVVLGVGTAESISFTYNGPSAAASTKGQETGAAAYLTSISPSDLPQIDDTATVTGGNFASDLEIDFISGTVVKPAKNVVVGSSTSAVVTRPDDLIEDEAPYTLRAINPGVTPPVSTNPHILSGTVTAGTDPSFTIDSIIIGAVSGNAFSSAIATSDSEGSVVSWEVTAGTVPAGLALATATGVLSGTPTVDGDYYFTVQITDDGGNTNSAEFNVPVGPQFTGGVSTAVGGTTYTYFTSSDDLVYKNAVSPLTIEYLVIAGGGAGGRGGGGNVGGGGGAGGLLFGTATLGAAGTATVTVGAAGAAQGASNVSGASGTDSVLEGIATAVGGGGGGFRNANIVDGDGRNGGSGGGKATIGTNAGSGIPGQGFDGNRGGGGAGAVGGASDGGNGRDFGAWASAIGIIYDSGYFAGGGGGAGDGGLGGGGDYANGLGSVSSGGGGASSPDVASGHGGSGLVVIRSY